LLRWQRLQFVDKLLLLKNNRLVVELLLLGHFGDLAGSNKWALLK
jgi:hypothetical protein